LAESHRSFPHKREIKESRNTFDHDDYHQQDLAVICFFQANKKGSLDVTGTIFIVIKGQSG
jgi:hypothetical protein